MTPCFSRSLAQTTCKWCTTVLFAGSCEELPKRCLEVKGVVTTNVSERKKEEGMVTAKLNETVWLHVCFWVYDVRATLGDWPGDYPGDRRDFVKRRYKLDGDLFDVVAKNPRKVKCEDKDQQPHVVHHTAAPQPREKLSLEATVRTKLKRSLWEDILFHHCPWELRDHWYFS